MLYPTLACSLALVALLPAQSKVLVSPAGYATKDAGKGSIAPFSMGGQSTHWRYQQLHGDLVGPVRIIGLAWRRDGATLTAFAPLSFNIRLDCSTAATSMATFYGDFDANHGPDRTTVVYGGGGPTSYLKVNWAGTTHSTVPAPFAYRLPFAKPFTFAGKVLVWDGMTQNNPGPTGTANLDQTGSDPAVGTVEWLSRFDPMILQTTLMSNYLCKATGQVAHAVPQVKGALKNNTWSLAISTYSLPRNSSAFWFIGHRTGRWGPLPLPFTLPGTTCDIVTPPLVVGPLMATGNIGMGNANIQFPHDPVFRGLRLFLQWAGLDSGKPQGLMLSRGLVLYFPLTNGSPPALATRVYTQTGLVTQFTLL